LTRSPVHRLSVEAFHDRYFSRRPVIITGIADTWSAASKWTLQELKQRFADARLPERVNEEELAAVCKATGETNIPKAAFNELTFGIIKLDAYFDAALSRSTCAASPDPRSAPPYWGTITLSATAAELRPPLSEEFECSSTRTRPIQCGLPKP
jgi:hypothetical protein